MQTNPPEQSPASLTATREIMDVMELLPELAEVADKIDKCTDVIFGMIEAEQARDEAGPRGEQPIDSFAYIYGRIAELIMDAKRNEAAALAWAAERK